MQTEVQHQSESLRYHSKVDAWIVIALIVPLLVVLGLGIATLVMPGPPKGPAWIVLGSVGVVLLLAMSITLPMYYEITSTALIVRSGLLQRTIPLSSIQRVFPTSNPLSAPAWSLDRLQIDYSQGTRTRFLLISPKEKRGFLQALAQRTGALELRDDGVLYRR